jgi:hypothetical protein
VSANAASAQSSVSPGGALIVGNAELPTPLNQLPDANIQMMKHQHQANQKRFDAVNLLRRQRISDESAQLLALTRDLKTKLERVGNERIPPALVRESEVIELLAHDVQEKMLVTVQ